jgi:hypothetical protein
VFIRLLVCATCGRDHEDMHVCKRCALLLLGVFLLVLFSFLRSFLLGHWFLFRAFSHTQLDHHIKLAEARNEAFGSPPWKKGLSKHACWCLLAKYLQTCAREKRSVPMPIINALKPTSAPKLINHPSGPSIDVPVPNRHHRNSSTP